MPQTIYLCNSSGYELYKIINKKGKPETIRIKIPFCVRYKFLIIGTVILGGIAVLWKLKKIILYIKEYIKC